MLEKNQQLTLVCENLGSDFEGVCRHEGMAVFIPGALPGEEIRCQVVKVQKRHAFARLLSVANPSPARQNPPCPYFEKCGGCTAQHMRYEETLRWKRRQVEDCFRRIGGFGADLPEVPPVLGMENPWEYRNKTSLPVGGSSDSPALGFYAPRSHRIVDIDSCPVAMAESNAATEVVRSFITRYGIQPYNEETREGLVRHLVVRVSSQGETMVVLVINGTSLPHSEALISMLKEALPGLASFGISPHRENNNVILGKSYEVLYGEERLEDTLCGYRFSLSPLSFFQVNPLQTEKLYAKALAFADLSGRETVADVYCGAGTISLLLSKEAREVIGIEVVPQAVADAKKNALANHVPNAVFHQGTAEAVLPKLIAEGIRPSVVVVDPPRKGMEPEVIEAIAQARPEKFVYVSCNPATQARDAALLAAHGYRITACQPVDMFCWTSGIENVIKMEPLA